MPRKWEGLMRNLIAEIDRTIEELHSERWPSFARSAVKECRATLEGELAWAEERRGSRVYGCKYAPNPENPERCVVAVMRGITSGQCSRKRGHGPEGLLCKQHARMVLEGDNLFIPPVEE